MFISVRCVFQVEGLLACSLLLFPVFCFRHALVGWPLRHLPFLGTAVCFYRLVFSWLSSKHWDGLLSFASYMLGISGVFQVVVFC